MDVTEMKFVVGDLSVQFESKDTVDATPITGPTQSAERHLYVITHKSGWQIYLAYMSFQESNDIRCVDYTDDTPDSLHRLKHGLRMSVYPFDNETEWSELSQARIKDSTTPNWSNLKQATIDELNNGAGLDVQKLLGNGNVALGRREVLLADDSKRKNYLCIKFARKDHRVPLIAFIVSRTLPLINGYT